MTRFLIGALIASVATSALAADLPPRQAPYAAPAYAAPFSWTGVYFGVNGGAGWASTNNNSFGGLSGWTFGGTAGANYQMGQFVIGAEGDWDWANISHTQSYLFTSNRMNVNETLTLRARAGMAIDRALIYVTGGYAGVNANASFTTPFLGWGGSQSQWISGGAVGAGVEYAFTNNISAKAEYLWLPMEDKTYWSGTPYQETNKLDVNLFRVGLNYKF